MDQSGFLIGPGMFNDIISRDDIGVPNGIAGLDANGEIPSSQLPSYVDDVIEGYFYNDQFYEDSQHSTVITPSSGKIYVSVDTGFNYRWSGSVYTQIAKYNEATTSVSGLMSATDKTKLDGIATGATAVSVVDNLNSDSTTSALSAAQGKALNSKTEFKEYTGDATSFAGLPNGLWYISSTKTVAMTDCPTGFTGRTYAIKADASSDQNFVQVYNPKTGKIAIKTNYGSWEAWDYFALNSDFANYFEKGYKSVPATADDRNLIGSFFTKASLCAGLPSSESNIYYAVLAFGDSQIAIKFGNSNIGSTVVYSRIFINDVWNGWQRIGADVVKTVYTNTTLAAIRTDLQDRFTGTFFAYFVGSNFTDGTAAGFFIAYRNPNMSADVKIMRIPSTIYSVLYDNADITSSLTWASDITFPSLKSAKYYGNGFIQISATISLSGTTNGQTIVTLPNNAHATTYASGFVDVGDGVPINSTVAYASISEGTKTVKIHRSGTNGYYTFSLLVHSDYAK